jgi:hypothetical protein
MKIRLTESQIDRLANGLMMEGWAFNEVTFEKLKSHIKDLYNDFKDLSKRHGDHVNVELGDPSGSVLSIRFKGKQGAKDEENKGLEIEVHNEAKNLISDWGKRKLEGGKFELGPYLKHSKGGKYADVYWLDEKSSKKVGLNKKLVDEIKKM